MTSGTPTTLADAINAVLALSSAGDLQSAGDRCAEFLTTRKDPALHRLAGLIAIRMERWADAREHLALVVESFPEDREVIFSLAHAQYRLEDFVRSQETFRRFLTLDPRHADAHFITGRIAERQGDDAAAIRAYETVVGIDAGRVDAWWNLATIRSRLDDRAGALAALKRLIAVCPDIRAYRLRAATLEKYGHFDECADDLAVIMKLAPPDAPTALALAAHRFRQERFPEAWEAYRHRVLVYGPNGRPFPSPHWNGESLTGKTVLASHEQGIGEQIMFASMLPQLQQKAERCIVECERRLVPLFTRTFPGVEFISREKPPHPRTAQSDIDFHLPLGDFGKWLRPSLDLFPKQVGYLKPPVELRNKLRQNLEEIARGRPIIAVSWASSHPKFGPKKSLPPEMLMNVMRSWPALYINVQYGLVADQLDVVNDGSVHIHRVPDVDLDKDLDSLAALLAATDAMITVSNSNAHIAGGLGVKTFVLLPPELWRYWYWFRHRLQNPWYPSVTAMTVTPEGIIASNGQTLADLLRR